ncbi:hypothetical protein GCM10027422_37080 [Hymenobacter arcticus]
MLLPLLSWGQTLIAGQNFEATPGTPTAAVTLAGGTFSSGNSGSNDSPPGAPLYSQGERAYGVTNGSATITSSTNLDASAYASASLSFRLASFSISSTTNGAEAGDRVTLAISTDGGATYVNQVIVSGNSNARWSFGTGTGTASRAYAATVNTTVTAPAGGGSRTNDGYSTVLVTGIPSTAQLRFRITLLNNDTGERWLVDEVQVLGNAAGPTTPTLAADPTSLSGFGTTAGTSSAAQTYALTGTNVTAATTVTAPTGYAVSLDGTTYAGSVSAPAAAVNSPAGQTIYVRLTGATAGSPSGSVTNASTGATTVSVAVSGTVTPAPVLTVAGTLSAFNALAGTVSAAQTYALNGSNLSDNVTVTAPTGFEVSQDGTAYAGTQTLPPASGSVAATISVRLAAATAAGTYGGTVRNASAGATTRTVAASGTVVGKPTGTPTVAAGTLTFNSATLTLGAADGTNLLVVVRPAGTTATAPIDQTTYPASTTYGAGTALGAGFVVLTAANPTSVVVTGLTQSTAYVADVYTYNLGTAAGFESYGPGSSSAAFTTPVQPQSVAGTLLFEDDFDYAANTVLNTRGWTVQSNTGVNVIRTATGNVTSSTYPQGAALSTGGTSSLVSLTTSGEDISKTGTRPTGTTTIYGAAVINVSAAQPNGDYFTGLTPNSTTYRSRVFIKSAGAGFAFGLTVGSETETYEATPTVFAFGTPYVLVVKAENSAATNNRDVASLYVLPAGTDITQEPATPLLTVAATNTGNSASALNTFLLRQGSASAAPTLTLDGVRLATGWGAAIGRPVFTDASGVLAAGSYYSLRAAGVGTSVTLSGAAFLEKQLNLDGGQVVTTATNLLTLRARNIIGDGFDILVNPGGTSFVDGPVARESATGASLLFPIGRSGNYRPLTLNISSFAAGTTTYTAVQNEGAPADQAISSPLTRISGVRYFSITPSPVPAASVFTGTVALSFGDDDAVTDPSLASFVVAKSDGAGWNSIGRGVNTATSLTSDTFQDFSDFILASTAADVTVNPLPVQLTSFTAARAARGVQLTWATATELGSDYFAVERSPDGLAYAHVAQVAAQGTTSLAHRYTATDAEAPATRLYYRLRQVDRSGAVAYSPVVTVGARAGAPAEFALAPNPTRASLSFLTEEATAYTVRNPLGQAVRTGTTRAGTNTVAVDELPAGMYLFELHGPQGRVVRRFVKE